MITRKQAEELVNKHMKSDTLKSHIREVEVIMRAIARELNENIEDWGVLGYIHDLDFDQKPIDPKTHTLITAKLLKEEYPDFPDEYIRVIKSHNWENTGVLREKPIDFALSAADNLSGMIYTTALIYPDRKITSVKVSSVLKKMKNPSFAAKVNRQAIMDIEKAGIKLERLIELGIQAMGEIQGELGL